jgi:hypothetical protein
MLYTTIQGEQTSLAFTEVTLNFKNMNTETNRILKLEKIGVVQTELAGPRYSAIRQCTLPWRIWQRL